MCYRIQCRATKVTSRYRKFNSPIQYCLNKSALRVLEAGGPLQLYYSLG